MGTPAVLRLPQTNTGFAEDVDVEDELMLGGDEDIDTNDTIFTADTEWGKQALAAMQDVLQHEDFDAKLQVVNRVAE